jgi:hypothetical protein
MAPDVEWAELAGVRAGSRLSFSEVSGHECALSPQQKANKSKGKIIYNHIEKKSEGEG